MRNFPFGNAALVILVICIVTGGCILSRSTPTTTSDLRVWVFAKNHYDAYKEAIADFEAENPGVKIDLQLVSNQAVTVRLQAAFWSDLDVPDVVEIPLPNAGSFLRGRPENIGFVDLTDRIKKSGLLDQIVRTRFAPYTSHGRIYGMPHDIHPVLIAYRRDIFEKYGIDVSSIKTWDDFIAIGHKFTIPGKQYMIELPETDQFFLESFVLQRGGSYFDANGRCVMDSEAVVRTMCWYVPLVTGPRRIANDLGSGQILTQAVESGLFLCMVMPDWRTKQIEMDIPRAKGKLALMPLPMVDSSSPRTTTAGGTMLGITKHCRKQDLAWKLAMHLYTNRKDLAKRFRGTNIIPPLKSAWNEPEYAEKRPYWSNQPIGKLYAAYAQDVPPLYTSPYLDLAREKASEALVACVGYYNAHGEKGFESYTRARLKQSADEVRLFVRRNPY